MNIGPSHQLSQGHWKAAGLAGEFRPLSQIGIRTFVNDPLSRIRVFRSLSQGCYADNPRNPVRPIRGAFAAAFPGADLSALNLGVLPAGDESFGDYQCNGAMAAAKALRLAPRAIAEKVVAQLPGRRTSRQGRNRRPRLHQPHAVRRRPRAPPRSRAGRRAPGPAAARRRQDADRRLLLAQRRQADAHRAHPLDRHRRRPQAHPPRPRLHRPRRQPSRRLGHPVRHPHPGLPELPRPRRPRSLPRRRTPARLRPFAPEMRRRPRLEGPDPRRTRQAAGRRSGQPAPSGRNSSTSR